MFSNKVLQIINVAQFHISESLLQIKIFFDCYEVVGQGGGGGTASRQRPPSSSTI